MYIGGRIVVIWPWTNVWMSSFTLPIYSTWSAWTPKWQFTYQSLKDQITLASSPQIIYFIWTISTNRVKYLIKWVITRFVILGNLYRFLQSKVSRKGFYKVPVLIIQMSPFDSFIVIKRKKPLVLETSFLCPSYKMLSLITIFLCPSRVGYLHMLDTFRSKLIWSLLHK